MGRRTENTGFRCVVCGESVRPLSNGSYRNHCPYCLSSLHVDGTVPGDRAATCGGVMDAVGVVRVSKGWQLVHHCRRCGVIKRNRMAMETDQPDDLELVTRLM